MIFLLLALLPWAEAAPSRSDLSRAERWACVYGDRISTRAWAGLALAVVDPDGFALSSGPLAVAYVNAGEADEHRSFWPKVQGKPFLIEPNPEWPGAHRADLRDPDWRRLLEEELVPELLARGYAGVMLDTLDVAEYLETKDPAKFAGSAAAAGELVLSLRRRHPGMILLINNALPLLDRVGEAIDGVLVEDVYTRCVGPRAETCAPTPAAVMEAKEAALARFREKTGKPVFALLYSSLAQRRSAWLKKAVKRCRAKGFLPYLASPSLERLGVVDPR